MGDAGLVTSPARKRKSLIWMNTGCPRSESGKEEVDKRHKTLRSSVVCSVTSERLRNEHEDKTKTQMTQSFNQYSENETKIWRQNILNQFSCVSSSCLRSHFVISLMTTRFLTGDPAPNFVPKNTGLNQSLFKHLSHFAHQLGGILIGRSRLLIT